MHQEGKLSDEVTKKPETKQMIKLIHVLIKNETIIEKIPEIEK